MRRCLIGQGSLSWVLIGCLLASYSLEVRGDGEYGSTCTVNSDCKLGFVCLLNTCACDSSYTYDKKRDICKKICRGSEEGLLRHGTGLDQYNLYRTRYTNCTYVDGNLELSNLDKPYDLSFLRHIEEVDGYVLIVNILSSYLHLRKLQIIRGNTLYEDKYSLYVALNHNPKNDSEGLLELQLTSLREIMAGQAYFHNNNLLCHVSTIRWDDINPTIEPPKAPMELIFNSKNYKRPCPPCPHDCYNKDTGHYHCWGNGPGMCQECKYINTLPVEWSVNYIKEVCSEACDGRCFGSLPNQCCHAECAAGCTSQKRTDCVTCKNFKNDGECLPFCPKMQKYDRKQMKWVDNPAGRYSFKSLCVMDCPGYMLKDNDACVLKCPEGKMALKEANECIKCEGTCPKKCSGIKDGEFLTSQNVQNFKGCTVVEGNMKIVKVSFEGDAHSGVPGLNPKDLKVLKDIKEITGYLLIQEAPEEVKDLSFFSGLEVISGRILSVGNAFCVLNMRIESLGLTSLRKISNGNVLIAVNSQLCYVSPIDFTPLFAGPKQKQTVGRNGDRKICAARGHVCDMECSRHGCWGPGSDKCIQCRNMQLEQENICLPNCDSMPLLYQSGQQTCRRCHKQCDVGCSGPGPNQCIACKKVSVQSENGSVCMEKCPEGEIFMYPDESRVCQPCDPSCAMGCSGPSTDVKNGGCTTCYLAINETISNGSVHCLAKDQEWCPRGYYVQQFRATVPHHPLMKKQVCQPCHPLCEECHAPGNSDCPVCVHVRYNGNCINTCPQFTFTKKGHCYDCHEQCLDCYGPNNTDCVKCKLFKIMTNKENNTFECVEKCPSSLPEFAHDTDPDKPTKTVCADETHPEVRAEKAKMKEAERKKLMTIIIPTCVGVLILGGLLVIFGYCWRQRERAKENMVKLTARMTGVVEAEPLTPTDAKPDLSKLRLIRESELRRGGIIGSGAFGTVYKGFWIPEGENVKIPVAIKILQEGTSPNQNQELLEEARVMASVEHPCCIRILAVCMATQMMLITQLMPLGCLLDYIRKHKDNTGSKSLLNWCTQIARGMGYLEDRGIVHRDLAARNVLVQSAGQVKITDFGLAKLLDYNEEEYHAAGGKMPIKWLALECIQHRIFTHKSDVWSYGVTAWELFTYGARPYESVRARDVPDLLEKGERLPQPNICTIDVYMIMIKCWMLDADSRPSFSELAEEFAKMARDPGRYLVIQGDKLMRLPSYSYDKDDLARHLSVAGDGPEEVIEAEEYLQPAPPVPLMPDNNNVKSPMLASPGGASNKEPAQLIREKRYGHLESAAAARQQRELSPNSRLRGDSINGRYSSDPVKYTRSRDEPDSGNVFIKVPSPMGNGNIPRYGGPKMEPERVLQLPLDEDDYLQPKSANPKAYLDLRDGKDYYLNEKQLSQDQDDYLVPSPQPVPSVFENPEYFEGDMINNDPMDKPLSPTSRNSVKPKIAPKPKRLTDYYNDISNNTNNQANRPLLSNSSSNCSNNESAV